MNTRHPDVSEEDLATFVGSRREYYLAAWRPIRGGTSYFGKFNGAAFLLTGSWLLYRRLYLITLVIALVALVESIVSEIVLGAAAASLASALYGPLSTLTYMSVIGLFGNRWYYHHAVGQIRALRSTGHSSQQEIAARGGTSWMAVLVGALAVLLVAFVARVLNT